MAVEVTAGARADLFPDGYNAWRRTIGCRVTVPATGGKANRAVIALISESLGIPASAVTIVAGTTASRKRISVSGMTKTRVMKRLCTLLDKNR